jgi:hypothetical protein
MGSRERYSVEVVPLVIRFFKGKDIDPLLSYLEKDSNLPGAVRRVR